MMVNYNKLNCRVEGTMIVRDDDVVIVENLENDKNDKKVVDVVTS